MSSRLILFLIFAIFISYKSIKKNPVYLVMLLVAIYVVYPEKYIWGLEEFRIVFVLNIVLLIAVVTNYGKIDLAGDMISWLMITFCLVFYLSAHMAEVSPDAAVTNAVTFIKLLFFWFLLKTIIAELKNLDLFYWAALLSLSFLALWGVQQYVLGNVRLEGFGGGQIVGSNQLASALVWGVPVAWIKIGSTLVPKRDRIVAGCCLFVLLAGIVCTESRQAFLALLFYGLIFFVQSRRKILLTVMGAIIITFSLNYMPVNYFNRMETIQEYENDASAMGRIEQWRAAVKVWADYPVLGVGPKNYYLIASRYTVHPKVTHNTFFQILSEEGGVGIGLFLGIMLTTLYSLGRIIKQYEKDSSNDGRKIFMFASTARLSLLGILITCMFQNKAEHEIIYWSSAIASALLVNSKKNSIIQ